MAYITPYVRITPLVINALMGRHTDTHTHTDARTKAILRNQACGLRPRTPGLTCNITEVTLLSNVMHYIVMNIR